MSVRKRKWTRNGVEKEAWVVNYTDIKGVRRLKTFARKKDADVFAATAHIGVRDGIHVADSATFTIKQAGEKWFETGTNAGLERSTLDQYRQHLDLHITPFLGSLKLSKINLPTIRQFQDQLRGNGRSPAMIKRVTVSLGSILADAQERGLIVRNAVHEMSRRRKSASKRERRQKAHLRIGTDIPTNEEIRKIIEHSQGRYRPLLLTAIFTGLRASELRGLTWDDVDLAKAEIHVRRRADKYHAIGMPKSDAGQRTIPLPPIVINTLKEWKLACPKGDLNLVFPNGEGNVEWHSNIVKRGLHPVQVAAGVVKPTGELDDEGNPIVGAKYTGMHALRHWFASWCINRRVDGGLELPGKMVQQRMGHSSIQMTMDVYGHLFPSTDDAEALATAERSLLALGATQTRHGA
ncbi:integrase [Sinorhizobium fredii]|uniref:Phage integrase family protein n=1 Tax=Sinorhizobium fredii (strain USDA 257) TaxID=1185652 RepID=I3WZG7_SINF2|nr:site-specific integrase [Sinorhizobium fredii]AFL49023.1 phage integrase family protein [Sinorhizobium fredii USDA 257]